MQLQDVLGLVGWIFLGIGILSLALAAFVFFKRDVRGVQADLSGKKRQRAVEEAGAKARRSRRRSFTGSLNTGPLGEQPSEEGAETPEQLDGELYTSVISAVEAGDDSDAGAIQKGGREDEITLADWARKAADFDGDDSQTGVLGDGPITEDGDDVAERAAMADAEQLQEDAGAEPIEFNIVRKIVLRESTGVIER